MKKYNQLHFFYFAIAALVFSGFYACTNSPLSIPTLTTVAISDITSTSATSGGRITSNGGATVTARGVCWSVTANPTIKDSITTNSAGIGQYASSISGLIVNTVYHVRAYATNSAGTAYGDELTFTALQAVVPTLTTTAATAIGTTTAIAGGNITSDGGATITARGVCWSTTSGPTIALTTKTSDGTGSGSFISNLTGLNASTTYYLKAYATNAMGTTYGTEVSFTTTALGAPALTTTAASSVGPTIATAGGNITSDGGSTVIARGVCWSTSSGPTINNSKTLDGTGTGVFTSSLTGLTSSTTYYLRAFATNVIGTTYGNEITFTTSTLGSPIISTTAISNIGSTTATSGGNVTSDGGSTVTARGVCWSTSTGPTISNNKTSDGTGTGSFTSSITGLVASTTYYLRAYATNGTGTTYGTEVSFTTITLSAPTLTTAAVSSLATTTATAGGNITSDGNSTITTRGVCWNTTSGPTISNSKTSDGTGTGSFTSSLTGLTASTTYYLRAYATNALGTSYGNEVTFTTTAASTNTAGTLTVTTTTSAAGGGYSPKNIVAIWIKTSTSGTFVKSLLVYAATRKNDLTNWVSNTAKNTTDAITGATQSGHAVRTCTWNATNVSAAVVANGDYKVCMELCDGSLSYHEFVFTKGPTAVTLTPANVTSFSSITIKWTPN